MFNIQEIYKELDDLSITTHNNFIYLSEKQGVSTQDLFFALARVIDDIEWLKRKLEV